MKASIILISMLIAVATWCWHIQRRNAPPKASRGRLHAAFKSIVAGVIAYFVLMAVAMLYLLLTTT